MVQPYTPVGLQIFEQDDPLPLGDKYLPGLFRRFLARCEADQRDRLAAWFRSQPPLAVGTACSGTDGAVLAVEVTGQGFVRASAAFGASSVSKYELRFPKIVALRSPTPGVDLERIVGLRAYQELGEAAVLGPVTDAQVRVVCDRVKRT